VLKERSVEIVAGAKTVPCYNDTFSPAVPRVPVHFSCCPSGVVTYFSDVSFVSQRKTGLTENDGHENDGPSKLKLQDSVNSSSSLGV